MREYAFLTEWSFQAPLVAVWELIERADEWPTWWRGVLESSELRPGDADGVGSIRRTTWKSRLPYKLTFNSEIIRVEKHRAIELRAFGELDGWGLWTFGGNPHQTTVSYDWRVRTDKTWMNLLAPVTGPLFRWNHDVIMRWGEEGLRRRLGSRT